MPGVKVKDTAEVNEAAENAGDPTVMWAPAHRSGMEYVAFDDAETYEPDEGWQRRALAGSDRFTFEWFEKPPGHSSPMHDHENEQVCLCLEGELTVHTEDDSVTLSKNDSVHLDAWESHRVENESDERAVGLDVFAPGRGFDFWTDRD